MEINDDFLMLMDSEAMLICMDKRYGGTGKKLSDISYLEFRERLYKKYYVGEVTQKETNGNN